MHCLWPYLYCLNSSHWKPGWDKRRNYKRLCEVQEHWCTIRWILSKIGIRFKSYSGPNWQEHSLRTIYSTASHCLMNWLQSCQGHFASFTTDTSKKSITGNLLTCAHGCGSIAWTGLKTFPYVLIFWNLLFFSPVFMTLHTQILHLVYNSL